MIYLDQAATSRPKPPGVAEAILAALDACGNSGRGTHPEALAAARTVYGVRCQAAALFGGQPERVAFTPNSTAALNIAIAGALGPGDHVISTDREHNSVLRPLYRLRAQGAAVDFVRADRNGQLDYGDFERLLRPETKAVVCTHASNLTGDVTDIGFVGEFARRHGLLFILDASQTAGVFPISMERDHIDVVCFTGHKGLMGPQGTGGLAVAEGVDVAPWAMGGTGVHSFDALQPLEWPTRLEAGTLNGHGIAGLSAGLDFIEAQGGVEAIAAHERALADRFLAGVREIPSIKLYGAFDQPMRSAIVSLNVGDIDSAEISDALMQGWGIATRPGAHCAPLMHRALGTERQGIVRFSFGYFNTDEEVDTAIEALRDLSCD